MYLRKSRTDRDFIGNSEELTLARHRQILEDLAQKNKYMVSNVFEEVVSGDSIVERPRMQELLACVETGEYTGVLVVDIDRLGRGNSIDQGIIQQTFKYSDTKIITPQKIYDFNNEYDEEYAEFGLFMGRKEYKMTKRRLLNGRLASVNEGKYCGGTAPFGYETYKLKGEKGFSLRVVPEQAAIVKLIFDWYINGIDGKPVGCFVITRKLNELGYRNQYGREWITSHIVKVINNETYTGKIVWYRRKEYSKIENGVVSKRAKIMEENERIVVNGLHDAIIDEDTFKLASKRKKNQAPKCNRDKELKNPFIGVLYCKKCGKSMMLRSADKSNRRAFCCSNVNCNNKGVYIDTFETKFLGSLKEIYSDYMIASKSNTNHFTNDNLTTLANNKRELDIKVSKLQDQLDKAFDLLEQGIYDTDTFIKRSELLKNSITECQKDISVIETEIGKNKNNKQAKELFIPKLKTLSECYYQIESAQEKNNLIKEIIYQIDYEKYGWGRGHSDEFTIEISVKYPV